ncbi:MAG: XRE family transcriptional regulator [Phenylobacterium sp.]|nr:MAG: XRE family transcriptional regulator [Phenylobacterium sp.]
MFGRRPNPVFGSDYARARAVLLHARRRAGLSQRALAQALGKANSHVTRIERGQRRIDLLDSSRWRRRSVATRRS